MENSYFFTWSQQRTPARLEVKETTNDSYITVNDKEVYDLSSCSYHLSYGLRNPQILKAIEEQYNTLPVAGPKLVFDLKENASKSLLNALGLSGKIFYTVSGAEAIENALKVARLFTKRSHIVARKQTYHGATMGALSITDDWRSTDHLTREDLTIRISQSSEDEDIKELIETIDKNKDKIAAVCIETIIGGNGVFEASQKWWEALSDICKKHEILIIVDEIVCGFYRTGKPFGFQHYPIKPDIVCMAKNISGGYFPFGAVYFNEKIAKHFDTNILSCGLTNYAHPIGLKICHTVLELIQSDSFKSNYQKLEKELTSFLTKIAHQKGIIEVRQKGLMAAIQLNSDSLTWQSLINEGLYINVINKNLIIMPIMTTTPERLKENLNKLKNIIQSCMK